jgi:hypothetical protein
MNGEIWLPNAKCNIFADRCRAISVYVSPRNNIDMLPVSIRITVRRITGRESSFFVIATKFPSNPFPTYIFRPGNIFDSLNIEYLTESVAIYQPSPFKPETVEIIRLDTVNRIISGTFAFSLTDAFRDFLVVTDGRFDLQFSACKCFN